MFLIFSLISVLSIGTVSCDYHIRNVGNINDNTLVYVWVKIPDGYQAHIPVINGNLPTITIIRDQVGKFIFLDCDYGKPYKYVHKGDGIVCYVDSSKKTKQKPPKPQKLFEAPSGMIRPSEVKNIDASKVILPRY
jgi:hypothetical protein